jgi:hypothetical protein
MTMQSPQLVDRARALAAGAEISDAELAALVGSTDLLSLGLLADEVRRARHGVNTTYVRVADINISGVEAGIVVPPAARDVRVRGVEVNAAWPSGALRQVVEAAGPIPVAACALEDLEGAAQVSGRPLADLLVRLRDDGVAAIAEASLDRLVSPEAAFEAVKGAGLDVARLTVHGQSGVDGRVALLRKLQALARATGTLRSFAPLARNWNKASPSTGYDDVRFVTVARLMGTQVTSIQVDWSLYGPKLAQVALTVGADDLDGVPASDDAPDGRRRAPLEDVLRNIRAAGLAPVERDGRYRSVTA